jgi:two-component system OmpR family sensor kinase
VRGRRLSTRLTVAAVAAVVIAVIVLCVAARFIVNHELRSSLDSSLRGRATDVARLAVSAPAVLDSPGALEGPSSGRQLNVEVVDRRGRIVARSLALGAKLLPNGPLTAAALHGRSGFGDFSLDGEPVRIFAAPIAEAGGPAAGGAVLVAASTSDITSTVHRLTVLLIITGLLTAAIGGIVAALLTRRGLRPLRELSASAAAIEEAEDPSRRLPEPASADELADLAQTLNRMLAALDAAGERERRFLAHASHELRTPLTSLSGNVSYLARHGAEPEVIADLEHDSSRLRALLDDLLALEREDGAARPNRPVRLDELVVDVASEHPRARAALGEPVTVLGEPEALRRAIENLVENAEVHGPAGGAITVALAAVDGHAELSVADEGPGFTPAAAERAFDRFWRDPDALGRPGSGLGLAIVKATAERHGGTVRAAGATVTITLPVA